MSADLLAPFSIELEVRRGRLCTGTSNLSSISRGGDIGVSRDDELIVANTRFQGCRGELTRAAGRSDQRVRWRTGSAMSAARRSYDPALRLARSEEAEYLPGWCGAKVDA